MPRRNILALLAFATVVSTLAVVAGSAVAEHDSGHRFRVAGQVVDVTGAPVCGVTVRAADITAPAADRNRTVTTDHQGRYLVQLHMHSTDVAGEASNEGDTVLVSVEGYGISRTISATRSPVADAWGLATVNFDIPDRVETICRDPVVEAVVNGALYVGVPAGLVIVGWIGYRRLGPRLRGRRDAVTRIPGVGHAKAEQLRQAGFTTIKQLANAPPKEVASATGMSLKETKRLVHKAQTMSETRGEAAMPHSDND